MGFVSLLSFALIVSATPTPCTSQWIPAEGESRLDTVVVVVHLDRSLATWGVTHSKVLNEIRSSLNGNGIAFEDVVRDDHSLPMSGVTRRQLWNVFRTERPGSGVTAVDSTAIVLSVSLSAASIGSYVAPTEGEVEWRASASFVPLGSTEVPLMQQVEGRSFTASWGVESMEGLRSVLLTAVREYGLRR